MKFISWNVNGIRSCLKKGFIDFYTSSDADIFAIQETKMQEGQSDFDFTLDGKYYQYWNSAVKKGYSGTAIFTKLKPLKVIRDIDIYEHDQEGRVITLEYEKFYFINVYVPNSQRELTRLSYRMKWEDDFKNYLNQLDKNKPIILCGDLNVAHTEKDIKNAKSNEKNSGYTIEERNKMTSLLDSGFTDTFRNLFPLKYDAYTWWSLMPRVREKNIGWRIDYFLISNRIINQLKNARIYAEIYGSDHCPIGLELNISN